MADGEAGDVAGVARRGAVDRRGGADRRSRRLVRRAGDKGGLDIVAALQTDRYHTDEVTDDIFAQLGSG